MQTKAPLDYETKASYSVEVTAKPPSGVSETIPVTIMVEDVSLGEVGDRYDTDRNEKINKQRPSRPCVITLRTVSPKRTR